MADDPDTPFDRLSDIDRILLRGAAIGLSSKEMAPMVSRSPHTIDDRLKALKNKLGAIDRFHAGRMLMAHEAGHDPLKDWGAQVLGLGGHIEPSGSSSKRGMIHGLAEDDPSVD